jgi:multicomponent K+:H+ antiporter subunit D
MLLQASAGSSLRAIVWPAILVSSLFALLALTRAGITVFWACRRDTVPGLPADRAGVLGAGALLACLLALTVLAEPVKAYTDAVAEQLRDTAGYAGAVMRTGGR